MPSTPRAVEMGAAAGSIFLTPLPPDTAYSRQPSRPSTTSPTAKRGWFDATTSPTTPPSITSPSATDGT